MLFGKNGNVDQEAELTTESVSLIMEAALIGELTTSELEAFLENHSEVQAALRDEVVLEKSIVRLDRHARLSHAQKMSVFTIAKEKNDPLMRKLLTVWRMERFLEAQLWRKYSNSAMTRARQAMNRSSSSTSATVKKVAASVNKQLNTPMKAGSGMGGISVPKNFR